ncbi:MAG: hypothetical protein LQ350_007473 [Teloschistes chrysophthalmus]|nr:MAG: hypothetical protein LQ350_007473 [Niorma chrysophthalma]
MTSPASLSQQPDTSTPWSCTALSGQKHYLLTLPVEIRNRVYDYVLLEDADAYPYGYKPCLCDCLAHSRHAPHICLLRVNKQINAEATKWLYRRAIFHSSTGHHFMKFMTIDQHICMWKVPLSTEVFPSRHQIRNLYLRIAPEYWALEDCPSETLDGLRTMERIASMSEAQVNHLAHYRLHFPTALVWINTSKVLAALESLETVTLDVEQAYCTEGCCRKCQIIVECFKDINGGRKKDNLPPVEIQIVGALDEEEEYLLALCIAGDFGEEDDSHEARSCDALENDQEYNDTEVAEDNLPDGEAVQDSDQGDDDVDDDDGYSTNSSTYDDSDFAFNKREYVEYGPEEEEVTASRKRYIRARFDRDTESPQGSAALSPLAQLHRTRDQSLATIRTTYRPFLLRPSHNFVWQQRLGMSVMRTSERRFAQQMIYASRPYYLVNHPFQQSYEDPQS